MKNNTHDGRQAAAKQKSNSTINQTIFISAECRRRLVALVASAIDTHTLGENRRARVCHAVLPLTQCVCVSLCIVWLDRVDLEEPTSASDDDRGDTATCSRGPPPIEAVVRDCCC